MIASLATVTTSTICPPSPRGATSLQQVNLRVAKNFKFTEHLNLGIFFEGFNLFNTANFGNLRSMEPKAARTSRRPINFSFRRYRFFQSRSVFRSRASLDSASASDAGK